MAAKGRPPARDRSDDYEVGYRKPPKSKRFKPGESGNPSGRPKGSKNLKTDLMEELGEKILVQEGGEARKLSKQRAVVKTLVNRTLQGDARAASSLLSMMMKLLDTGEGTEPESSDELLPDEIEILEAYKERLTSLDAEERVAEDPNAQEEEE